MTPPYLSRPPEEGARLLALAFLDQATEARGRLAQGEDAEALHDFRVALRRLRSLLRAYRGHLGKSVSKKLAKRLQRLAGSTGPGRDAEVQIEWLTSRRARLAAAHRSGLDWLVERLDDRMQAAYEDLRDEVDDEFQEVAEGFRRRLSVYKTEVHLDPAEPPETLGTATSRILHEQVADLEERLGRIASPDDEDEAHEARIRAKRVRYLLEPLVPEIEGAGPLIKRFKHLQDLLGDLHDAHVLEDELSRAVETAAAERARRVLDLTLSGAAGEPLLRAEKRRDKVPGLIALARDNRERRDRRFDELRDGWLDGRAHPFLRQVEALGDRMAAGAALDTQPPPPVDSQT